MTISKLFSSASTAVCIAAAAWAIGCGESDTVEKVQQQGEALQKQGQALQVQAQKTADDVRSGKKDPEAAARELERDTKKLADNAKKATSEVIDTVKDDAMIPDEAREELEKAQAQLAQPTP